VVRRGEAAARTGASRKKGVIWGKTVKCPGVYTEPPPFVMVRIRNREKRPFSPGSCYEPRLKVTFLSRLVIRTVTSGAFARDAPKANFHPFVTVGVTSGDKRGSFSLGWYHYLGLKGNFAWEINISLFLAHLSHSFCFEH
jgi:hypothetical protein